MSTTSNKDGEFDFAEFLTKNKKQVMIGAGAVAVIAVGTWFWIASNNLKEDKAEQAYAGAERSFYSGNTQLAETDLAKVVQRYGGTSAGARATILLAKNYFVTGKPSDGITKLHAAIDWNASKPFRAPMYALIGAGYENQTKFDSAATAYGEAVASANVTADKETYEADQARALTSAGKGPAALKIWQGIADRLSSPLAAEARLRIGELTASPVK
jgi:tetratricopeptide (TPR) repeat protein